MGAIKVEDTKVIRFSNMTKFVFNEDQTIIFNRLNGQWIKVPMVNATFGQSDEEHFDTQTICAFLDKIVAANPKKHYANRRRAFAEIRLFDSIGIFTEHI